jgi:hypothetical protein
MDNKKHGDCDVDGCNGACVCTHNHKKGNCRCLMCISIKQDVDALLGECYEEV